MSEFLVSARKYRPVVFGDMVGQEHVSNTLRNAIKSEKLAHAFLFCGPRGVGKTTAARILAKTINCENPTADFEACGACNSCVAFSQNSSFNIYELDAASNNSVDDIRELVTQVRFPPQSGKFKIYIIDEVHMLSSAAFNAFLKTLEEPPSYCKFILATTEKHKILPTILSRCQVFDFRRISTEVIVNYLRGICQTESIPFEEDALHIIAQKSDGGMRDALSMLDRLVSFGGGKLAYTEVLENLNVLDYDYFFKITEALLAEDVAQIMLHFNTILQKGFEGDDFIIGLCEHFRNLLFCKDAATVKLLEMSNSLKERYAHQASLASGTFLVNCLALGNQCDVQYKQSKNKRLTVELTLVKMCYINRLTDSSDAVKKKTDEQSVVSVKSFGEDSISPALKTERGQEFLNQVKNLNEEDSKPAIKNGGVKAEATEAQPVVPTASSSSIRKTSKLISFDDAMSGDNKKQTSQTVESVNESKEEYIQIVELNQENLEKLWKQFGEQLPDHKRGAKVLFTAFKPVFSGVDVATLVQSSSQKEKLDEEINALRYYLKKYTGVDLNVNIEVDKSVVTTTFKPYTDEEKMKRLIEKNPSIKLLQQKFGLSLDYDS
jgi:DNA polymerase-3 subunit gamma/tau